MLFRYHLGEGPRENLTGYLAFSYSDMDNSDQMRRHFYPFYSVGTKVCYD